MKKLDIYDLTPSTEIQRFSHLSYYGLQGDGYSTDYRSTGGRGPPPGGGPRRRFGGLGPSGGGGAAPPMPRGGG